MNKNNYVYVRGRVIMEDQDGRKLVVIMENSRDPVARWLDKDDCKKFIVSDGYNAAGLRACPACGSMRVKVIVRRELKYTAGPGKIIGYDTRCEDCGVESWASYGTREEAIAAHNKEAREE